jgi:DNA-binding NtrC family response regulator
MSSRFEDIRVLVVDAQTMFADSLALFLNSKGYDARAVYSSEAALMVAQEFNPQALISEVIMPGMNGIDLANYFAERYPECKVLLVSGRESVIEVLENVFSYSNLTFLRKPLLQVEVFEFLATCRATSTPPVIP